MTARVTLAALALGLAVATPALADGDKAPAGPEDPSALARGQEPKFPNFDDVVSKELETLDGIYPLYHNEKKLEGFLEVPANRLEKPFLLATSLAGGTAYTGWQWSDALVYWKRQHDKLLLIEKEVTYRAKKGSPVEDAVKRTYTDSLILAMPIKTRSRKGGYILDLKDLFAQNAPKFFGRPGAGLDASLAEFTKLKVFPENMEIAVTMPPRGGGRFVTLYYSLRDLGNSSFKPRTADPRIGYFLTVGKDYSEGPKKDGRFQRFINRWNIEKLDNDLELSPVKEPIVFYLEKTIPVEYRQFVAEGILEWNKAFRAIGFLDAVQVRQQTETNEFKDFDPEDARYNFIRWITSDRAYAMGPSRANPLTGEILDADIVFDDSMVNWALGDYERYFEKAGRRGREHAMFRGMSSRQRFMARLLSAEVDVDSLTPFDREVLSELSERVDPRQHQVCHFGMHKRHELALLALEAKSQGEDLPLEYLGAFVKETVMHEVGHTLGLRHNFVASTWKPISEINSDKAPEAIVASVMDYNPINVAAPKTFQGPRQTMTVGPYDMWAIEYGYTVKGDDKSLAAIAGRSAEPGHAYATDEDVYGPDPYVNRWDMGQEPLNFARDRVAIAREMAKDLEARAMKDGQSYRWLRRSFSALLYEYDTAAWFASRYVGGIRVHRHHKGDEGALDPLEPVDAAKQREALAFILSEVLAADAMQFRPELLRKLGSNPWSHWGSDGGASEYPVTDRIHGIQAGALTTLLSSGTLSRLQDTALSVSADQDLLTVPELFKGVTAAVFSELNARVEVEATPRASAISPLRRKLQRALISHLIDMANDVDGGDAEARNLAWQTLAGLKTTIDGWVAENNDRFDPATQAHLDEAVARIVKAREAAYQLGGGGGGGGGGIILMLGKDGKLRPATAEELEMLRRR